MSSMTTKTAPHLMVDLVSDFLHVEPDVVSALHERAELLPALLAQLGLEMRAQRAASVARDQVAESDSSPGAVLRAIAAAWGDKPFQWGELLPWAEELAFPGRAALLAAVRAFAGSSTDEDLDAARVGMLLAPYKGKSCEGLTLLPVKKRNGSGVWRVVKIGDLGDLVP